MKKLTRCLTAVLLTGILCLTMSSCTYLDEMRNRHAYYTENGTIIYQGAEYILLPECESLSPIRTKEETAYITERDVPVLLSEGLGDRYNVSDDGVFLVSETYIGDSVYCRKDRYEEVRARIEKGADLTGYCYETYALEDADTYVRVYYSFTDEEVSAVNKVFDTVEGRVIASYETISYSMKVYVNACSSDLLFKEYAFDIYENDGKYLLVRNGSVESVIYEVPDDLSGVFDKIVELEEKLYNGMI